MKYIFSVALAAFPFLAGAATAGGVMNLLKLVTDIVGALVPVIIGIAVLTFIWGLLKYITAKDSEAQGEARTVIISGIVVIFVMVSVWGLVNLLGDSLALNKKPPELPQIPGVNIKR